ncbi:hypothetical protein BDY21DRAFT_380841 [Lineolata rhizophorae]|uniref:Helicase ATP-binding domain-containing protein n=1 Tax=Lineolata rhizophorae TaxID=578093 RepID=A0A6A6NV22_9PEZI|nr:hypothetical protein BDY21DRAFT_380841 [Lineolata rhizophorae]
MGNKRVRASGGSSASPQKRQRRASALDRGERPPFAELSSPRQQPAQNPGTIRRILDRVEADSGSSGSANTSSAPHPFKGNGAPSGVSRDAPEGDGTVEVSGRRPRRNRRQVSYREVAPVGPGDSDLEDDGSAYEDQHDATDPEEFQEDVDDLDTADEAEDAGANDEASEEEPPIVRQTKKGRGKGKASAAPKSDRPQTKRSMPIPLKNGIKGQLKPISGIEEIFADLVGKAVSLDFLGAVKALHRPLRVATMCSGTESPLLAMEMVSDALEARGLGALPFEHLFSAEIEPFKQAYIERNFSPPIIFRDVTEFFDHAKNGRKGGMVLSDILKREQKDHTDRLCTTAYGAKVPVPGDVDILVAGFVCKDFSRLNALTKTLEQLGQSGSTFFSILLYCKEWRPKVVILENVQGAPWQQIIACYRDIGYAAKMQKVDTKDYYLPQTRNRGYLIAIDRSRFGQGAEKAVEEWTSVLAQFKRPASAPVSDFLFDDDDFRVVQQKAIQKIQSADWKPGHEPPWTKCQARHDNERHLMGVLKYHPYTNWQMNGYVKGPDYVDRHFLKRQVARVKDAMEIQYQRNATKRRHCFDSEFKMRVWDLSQNVDRFTDSQGFGLSTCVTPDGIFYLTTQGRTLTGYEMLHLQGIPTNKISFTTETNKNIGNLAGNAMSSTVVGSCIMAALIVGHKILMKGTKHATSKDTRSENELGGTFYQQPTIKYVKRKFRTSTSDELPDLDDLLMDANASSRRCYCEARHEIASAPIQTCQSCWHTSCRTCGGNPGHQYGGEDTYLKKDGRLLPFVFERRWAKLFPVALVVNGKLPFEKLKEKRDIRVDEKLWKRFVKAVETAFEHQFFSRGFIRGRIWKFRFESKTAIADLILDPKNPLWHLFAKPDLDLAVDDDLRKFLSLPVARASVSKDHFYGASWAWRIPTKQTAQITIKPSKQRTRSWLDRVGVTECQGQTQPVFLTVDFDRNWTTFVDPSIKGEYQLLDTCGTANSSLYKKKRSFNEDGSEPKSVYLFYDPHPLDVVAKDQFVFALNSERLANGERRMVLGRLDSCWKPWEMASDGATTVTCSTDGVWVPQKASPNATRLAPSGYTIQESSPAKENPWTEWVVTGICSEAVMALKCRFHAPAEVNVWRSNESGVVMGLDNARKANEFFSAFAWVWGQLPGLNTPKDWTASRYYAYDSNGCSGCVSLEDNEECQSCGRCGPAKHCQACAPSPAAMQWNLKGDKAQLILSEDPRSASQYEKAFKTRPREFEFQAKVSHTDTWDNWNIQIGINYTTLEHRATARLLAHAKDKMPISLFWKLETNYRRPSTPSLHRFSLRGNINDPAYRKALGMRYDLRPEQKRSLAWMVSMEDPAADPFVTEEIEEAIFDPLKWRAVAKAEAPIHLRGGVLADQPGYGKTVTILALTHSGFKGLNDLNTPAATPKDADPSGLIELKATVIVCPQNLVPQWRDEINKFLPKTQYGAKEVVIIKNIIDFKKRTIKEYMDAKIIILPWAVLCHATYTNILSEVGGLPDPAVTKSRAYATWLPEIMKVLPDRIAKLKTLGPKNFSKQMAKLKERLMREAKKEAFFPSELFGQTIDEESKSPRKTAVDWTSFVGPPLHMFKFDRLVVDEFNYLTENHPHAVAQLQSDKRWILSGTPSLRDFADVKRMAQFLGIDLGIDSDGPGVLHLSNSRRLKDELTDAELFQSYRSVRSATWHEERHRYAQRFLDHFVRQNDGEMDQIKATEYLVPVRLRATHQAVYTELSQHAIGRDMIMGRDPSRFPGDRVKQIEHNRLHDQPAEVSLLRGGSAFDSSGSNRKLGALLALRDEEYGQICRMFRKALAETVAFMHKHGDDENGGFDKWKMNVLEKHTLEDEEATDVVRPLVEGEDSDDEIEDSDEEMWDEDDEDDNEDVVRRKKNNLKKVQELAKEIATRARARRYVRNIKLLHECFSSNPTQSEPVRCDGSACTGFGICKNTIGVLSRCGHLACTLCLDKSAKCVVNSCGAPLELKGWLDHSRFLDDTLPAANDTGKKIDDAVELVKSFPKEDQVLVFAPMEELMQSLQQALTTAGIRSYCALGDRAGKYLEDFKVNTSADRRKVLILNLSDETAAGHNLTNANHIIFLTPLLAETQTEYQSQMKQAICRARRYGQTKVVHIYRMAALHTIDVDILEHRERRDAPLLQIGDADKNIGAAVQGVRAERTKIVSSADGTRTMLVPRSCLSKAHELGVDKNVDFSTLLTFSPIFIDEWDDEDW